MCSISGIINFDRPQDQRKGIKGMCDAASHRGPDGEGYVFFDSARKERSNPGNYKLSDVALGHRRLKIIDLTEKGAQPMSNEDGSIWIVQNGEIYNYLELKGELVSKGHKFASNSDSEVIIHAYEEYGEGCLSRFNGMWSFALYDVKKSLIFCARDRLGKKPFFYYHDDSVFVFSSEIKSILASGVPDAGANYKAVFAYLVREPGYTSVSGETFFKDIMQLKAAHYLILPLGEKKISINKYWNIPFSEPENIGESEYIAKFSALFKDAVRIRLRSDVRVSAHLSGGLDSSSVTAVAALDLKDNSLMTFSSCFDDPAYDEREYIKEAADKYNLESVCIFPSPAKLLEDLDSLIWHQEEPFLHLNVYAQWQIMRAIHEKGIKVVLNGHGGDEGLGGYIKDFAFYYADLLRNLDLKKYCSQLKFFDPAVYHLTKGALISDSMRINISLSLPRSLKDTFKYGSMAGMMNREFRDKYAVSVGLENAPRGFLRKSSFMGYQMYPIPGWLKYEDRASMAHSIESRSPFLDYRLVEFMSCLPNDLKIRDGITKFILRESMKGILPEKIRTRKDKKGFPTPSADWFRNEIKGYVLDIINSESFKNRGIFNTREVAKAFEEHCEGKKDLKFEIWSWINLELWMRKFFD